MGLRLENCDLLLEMGFDVHLVSDLKRRWAQNIVPSRYFLTTAILSNETSINLAEMHCKNCYKMFYGNCPIDPSGIRNWQKKVF